MEREKSKKRSKPIKQRQKIKNKNSPRKKVNCSSENKKKRLNKRQF